MIHLNYYLPKILNNLSYIIVILVKFVSAQKTYVANHIYVMSHWFCNKFLRRKGHRSQEDGIQLLYYHFVWRSNREICIFL